jgi:hypothetical protein
MASVSFDCDTLAYFDAGHGERVLGYELEYDAKVPFIKLNGGRTGRWLALFSDSILFLYSSESSNPFFRGTSRPRAIEGHHFSPQVFTASSHLVEGETHYPAANLGRVATREPWVEGIAGHGIGEEIVFERPTQAFWISNGYVSFSRPELYTMNSRPRSLRVLNVETGEEAVVELQDSPNPQRILLDSPAENVRVVILAVYEGSHWDDTAVNFIMFF